MKFQCTNGGAGVVVGDTLRPRLPASLPHLFVAVFWKNLHAVGVPGLKLGSSNCLVQHGLKEENVI